MHKSNQFLTTTKSDIFITKIEGSFNPTIAKAIYTYQNELKPQYYFDISAQFLLILSENENFIVAFKRTTVYFLVMEDNGNWMLQQRKRIEFEAQYLIQGYQLNIEGNILIINFQQSNSSIFCLIVFLRVNGIWQEIKEFHLERFNPKFCVLDDKKFLIFTDEDYKTKLSIFQIFSKTFEVKLLQTQDFKMSQNFQKLRFFTKRGLLIAWKNPFVYVIQQVNEEFKISSQLKVSKDLWFSEAINEKFLVFSSPGCCGESNKIKVSKLFGK